MKYFTHPEGIFATKTPLNWYYKNKITRFAAKYNYSFELIDNPHGAFLISCYPKHEKKIKSDLPEGKYNQNSLFFTALEILDVKFYFVATRERALIFASHFKIVLLK